MQLETIADVVRHDGPFVTIHAEVGRDTEDAVSQRQSRWTTLRHDLEKASVAAELIAEIGRRLGENPHDAGAVRRTIVAAGDEIVFDETLPGRSHWPEEHTVGPLPHLAGWLTAADAHRRFLLVVTDRTGADLSVHHAAAGGSDEESTVEGDDFYITKVAEGDWAQKQFQQTAENTWQQNAALVADEVRRLARKHRTTATLVAGETRARAEVVRALESGDPATSAPVIEIEAGGRAPGSSDEALWDEVTAVMTRLVREDDTDLAARLEQALGQGEGALTGVADVAAALAQSQVEHLVLDLQELNDVTLTPDQLTGVPLPQAASDAEELAAGPALVAAAALTGAQLSLLPRTMAHSPAAALLRWS